MEIIMFGTGNANVVDYYNTCFALREDGFLLLVDGGGGNQILKKLNNHNIPIESVHNLFITHEHIDHLFGAIWLIRVIGQKIFNNKYDGSFNIYCDKNLIKKIIAICEMTLHQKVLDSFGKRIIFHPVKDRETKIIDGKRITFFDAGNDKSTQFGFSLVTNKGKKLTCLGDVPYNARNEEFIRDCNILMHEAFCLYSESDKYRPYEKSHSTVKEPSELAEEKGIPNLLLYHTEDKNKKDKYIDEAKNYYSGNIIVPSDDEIIFV